METIGLSIQELTNLIVSLKVQLTKDQEENIQSNTTRFISEGCAENEARFRAGIIGIQAIDTSAILGIIVENNRRILSDLREAGIL